MSTPPRNHRMGEVAIIVGTLFGVAFTVLLGVWINTLPVRPGDDPAIKPAVIVMGATIFGTVTVLLPYAAILHSRRIEFLEDDFFRIHGPFTDREFSVGDIERLRWQPYGCRFHGNGWALTVVFPRERKEQAVMQARWWRQVIPVSKQDQWEATVYRWLMSRDWQRRCGPPESWKLQKRSDQYPLLIIVFVISLAATGWLGMQTENWIPAVTLPPLLILYAAVPLLLSIPSEGLWVRPLSAPERRPIRRTFAMVFSCLVVAWLCQFWLGPQWFPLIALLMIAGIVWMFFQMYRYDLWLAEWQRKIVAPHLAEWETEWLTGPLPADWPHPDEASCSPSL